MPCNHPIWLKFLKFKEMLRIFLEVGFFRIYFSMLKIFGNTGISLFRAIQCTKYNLETKTVDYGLGHKDGFPLSRNFYVRTDVNFNWLYVRIIKIEVMYEKPRVNVKVALFQFTHVKVCLLYTSPSPRDA